MPGSATPQILYEHGVTVVTFGPDLTRLTEDCIQETLQVMLAAVPGPHPCLLIDLSHVEFFGSSFIEVLFRVWNRVQQSEGRFALCCLSPNCTEVIQVTNLDRLWPMFPSREAAIQALRKPATT